MQFASYGRIVLVVLFHIFVLSMFGNVFCYCMSAVMLKKRNIPVKSTAAEEVRSDRRVSHLL